MQRAAELIACYEHVRPDGSSPLTAYAPEFSDSTVGENAAWATAGNESNNGWGLEEHMFTGWKEENEKYAGQGHRRNMLNENYTSVGIGHVIYNGVHYWVQEFSSKVVDTDEKEANDSLTTVKMPISDSKIKTQTYVPIVKSITMEVGQLAPPPLFHRVITTDSTIENSTGLELLEPFIGKWDFKFSEKSYLQIDNDGHLFATRALSLPATASYDGTTVTIPITVTPADSTPTPSVTPEPSATPNPSDSPNPSEEPSASVTQQPDATQKLTATKKPTATQKPTSTQKPTTTQKPTSTQKPAATRKPTVTSNAATVGTTITASGSNDVYVVMSAGSAGNMREIAYKKPSDAKKKTIVVPSKIVSAGVTYQVTSIAPKALKGSRKTTKVKIPATVKKIGASAFDGCRALKTVTIGKGVTTIEKNAFRNCKKLKKITVKSNVIRTVGKRAFKDVPKKAKIKVPKAKQTIYQTLFTKAGLAKSAKVKS